MPAFFICERQCFVNPVIGQLLFNLFKTALAGLIHDQIRCLTQSSQWQFLESSLNEMAIKSQGGLNSHFFHRDKGNTVRQRIHFIGMIFKVFP